MQKNRIVLKRGILSNCVSGSNEFLTFQRNGVIKLRKLVSKKSKSQIKSTK
jgi:hypothetical protein